MSQRQQRNWLFSFPLISLPGILGIVLLSESFAATPGQFSPIFPEFLAQQPQNATQAAERAYQEGMQLFRQGTAESLTEAISKFEQALQLYRAVEDETWEATTLLVLGRTYDSLGQKQQALDYYNQALPLFRAVEYRRGEAATLNNLGLVYNSLGEKQQALDYYNQALPLFRAVEYRRGEATTLNNIGLVYKSLGEKQQALDYLNQALPLLRAVGDRRMEAGTLNNLGYIYNSLGEKQQALDYYNQALPLRRAMRDTGGEATTLTGIGSVYDDLGEKQQALDYYNQALPLRRAVGDRGGEATTLTGIGSVYNSLGEKQQALDYFNQALPLYRAVEDRGGEATTLNNIGLVYDSLGEFQQALDYYNQALPLLRAVGDISSQAAVLNNLGAIYNSLGEFQQALDYFNQVLPLFRAVGDRGGEATTLNNIGSVYDSLGEKQQALDYYNQALPLYRAVGDRGGEATTLNNLGYIYNSLGEKQQALDYFNQALPLLRAVKDRGREAVTLNNLGSVYSDLGKKQQALDYYNQALPLSRAVGDRDGEATTLYNLASSERDRGNLNTALTQIEAAINIVEDLRTKIGSQELRQSYFATVQDYYKFYIDLLMELHQQNPNQGYDAQALHISERARARSLLELLTEANADIRQGVDPQLLAQEENLLQQINALEHRKHQLLNSQYTQTEIDEINALSESLLSQLDQLEAQIRVTSPRYADLKYPEPLTLKEIQQQVLDDDTLLLQYSLGKERSYLWAVTKDSITSYELPPQADIEAAAKEFYTQLESPDIPESETAVKLSQMILAPVAAQLSNKRLLIVGDGALQSIPFAALPVTSSPTPLLVGEGSSSPPFPRREGGLGGLGYTPLLAQNEIVTLPSASTIAINREQLQNRSFAPKTLAVIADPIFNEEDSRLSGSPEQPSDTNLNYAALTRSFLDFGDNFTRLEFTRKEAETILALVPENQRSSALDFAASRELTTSPELAEYQIVHFATHGLINLVNPELSGIVLSLFDENGEPENGFLRLHDIFNLNLPAELVVLSACQTGLGEEVQGEGLVGLTRGFMYAGAKRVVVSLWSVNDVATSELMGLFYQKMLSENLTPVQALREAQLEMLKSQNWQAPYYWAAFTIQGEWQ
ncbi:MAG: tetratricopeptide repeat protein [Kamptonema sp. SIO1D9]|nr:tetratricopeptide repeat protein [Kamptonema sp. SIO1D9]